MEDKSTEKDYEEMKNKGIRTSLPIETREDYEEIKKVCKETSQPIFLTEDKEDGLIVMSVSAFCKRERMLQLREELLEQEEGILDGTIKYYTVEELDKYLTGIIDGNIKYDKI